MIHVEDRVETQSEHEMLKGALAGLIATAPMTLFVLTTQRFLPKRHRYDLPPEIITKEPPQRNLMMLAAHLVWGSAMGATADVLMSARGRRRLPS